MSDLRYPIGRFDSTQAVTEDGLARAIDEMSRAPAALVEAVGGLTPEQMETPHRPDGWCPRQIAHHIPDSHMNGYVRMKLALTEDAPTIKAYEEDLWAELADTRVTPVAHSLALLEALHARWVALARALGPAEWKRPFRHPESGKLVPLDVHVSLYAWHGRHHVAQITSLRDRMGWR
jgi:hypothetical protein